MFPATTEERLSRLTNHRHPLQRTYRIEYTEAFRRIRFGLGSTDWRFLYS